MTDIVLMSDPAVAAIPVRERAERLVDVRADGRLLVDRRKQDRDGHFAQVRDGVAGRLLAAQDSLPDGLRILFVEGYRPLTLQRAYFEEYLGELRLANPAAAEQELFNAASRYVSPPDIAPHSAGAAVDLTLTTDDGAEVDMGTRVNANPEESGGACFTVAQSISAQARANRDLLGRALASVGFVNYPTEWWHWSYGDRYWALAVGAPAACYGPVNRPGGGALAGHVVGGGQHLPTDGLQLDLGQDEPGRDPLGHAHSQIAVASRPQRAASHRARSRGSPWRSSSDGALIVVCGGPAPQAGQGVGGGQIAAGGRPPAPRP